MMVKRLAAFVAVLLLASSSVAGASSSSAVIEVTDRTADLFEHGEWIVDFYATWCSVCKRFEPEFDRVAEWATSRSDNTLQFASVNAEINVGMAARFLISAIPTVYYIKDGVAYLYEKPPMHDPLKTFIENKEYESVQPWEGFLAPYSFLYVCVSSLSGRSRVLFVLQRPHPRLPPPDRLRGDPLCHDPH